MNANFSPDSSMPKDEEICKTDELTDRTHESDSDESINPVSEEEGLEIAKGIFREGEEADEDKDFVRDFLRHVKFTRNVDFEKCNIYIGGVHVSEGSSVIAENIIGGDQKNSSINYDDTHQQNNFELKNFSIEEIFDKHETIKDRSFILALAALDGCNYRIVVDASKRLQGILQEKEKGKTEEEVTLKTNERKRSEWLEEISAHLDDSYEPTEYGKSPIKVVSFRDKESHSSLLRHIWYEYDSYADGLLQWLYELGEHANIEVRLRAATVAGQLAIYEFRPVREKIFLPWAKSDKQSLQRLTALALSKVAYNNNKEAEQQALNILHHWSGLKNSIRLNRTAIIAYGSYIGLFSPQQAFDNLKLIAQSGDGRLFSDIAQAVAGLFSAGQQLVVLNMLKEWIEQHPKTALHRLSLVIFCGLMRKTSFIEDVHCPILLVLSERKEEAEKLIVFLARNSLHLELTRNLAIQEIRSWIQFVDKQQNFYDALARIIFRLAVPGREQERICSFLSRWSMYSDTSNRLLKFVEQYS